MSTISTNAKQEGTEQPVKDVEMGKTVDEEETVPLLPTDPDTGLTSEQVEAALEKWGPNDIPVPESPLYMLFLRQFTGFLPLLIEIAAIVSLAAQDFVDFAIILGILLINAILGFREEYHAKKSLDEVSGSLTSEIAVRRDGKTKTVVTTELVPGDICLLVGGAVVPADVKWLKGDVMSIDTAALTGEPLPRKYPSDEYGYTLLSGTTVKAGECYVQVMATAANTEIGQAQADILKDKSIRVVSVFQAKIMMVVQALVSFSLAIVIAVLLVDGLYYGGFDKSVRNTLLNALSIMIAAIPVALPLVLQVNLALGASFLAKEHNAIVTSIPALQDIASMSILCSDKTGTLTTANMSIISDRIFPVGDFKDTDVIVYGYLCSNPDKKEDPIDRAVVSAYERSLQAQEKCADFTQDQIIGFNPEVKRTVSFVTKGNKKYTIAKGLPAKIIDTTAGGVDNHEIQWKVEGYNDKKFLEKIHETDQGLSKAGYKTIAVAMCEGDARNDDEDHHWLFVGLMPMLDPPREDTANTIESLHQANISVKMITGDHVNVGKETARLIGLGTNIQAGQDIRDANSQETKNQLIWDADGFASVLPSDKREVVLTLRNTFGLVTGMTGDGVNDAPALSAAQVGIAVEGATDAAKNAADLILTEPGLSPIYGAVLESRRIFARIKAYVVYRVAASAILVLNLSIIMFATGCAVDSLLVIILALLNDISMIPVAYDNAKATRHPQLPDASKLVLSSLYYSFMHTGIGLIFIFVLGHTDILTHPIDLTNTCNDETQGFIWLYLVLVTEFAIFSVRAPRFFWQSMPSPLLIASVLLTCAIGTIIAVVVKGLEGEPTLWIWIFNIIIFIFIDLGKVIFKKIIKDDAGETIDSDELVQVDKPKSETVKHVEKGLRNIAHQQASRPVSDMGHSIEITENASGAFASTISAFTRLTHEGVSDGLIYRPAAGAARPSMASQFNTPSKAFNLP
ncbi:Plasma membrane ATPase 2 (Fragment) [Seminavis robusta]|uniref:Plasma membrane ATPase n=1 Tax=Seminavis robusta TaxID=568900 RepID=A0A9N8E6A0_9STRA